ncbi:Proline-rich receptor-like protein kinase PERK8 [Vitis vinifera]|uniref:Proline-rich receptor-like protein kinase PERK8 n=1 Tax=Vitis vinifera TaxID=29760 RepID=A0A438CEI5_VITVI|nr:Proline-rich receptor-like protein kinase PERK8 [Vitis vinifera]
MFVINFKVVSGFDGLGNQKFKLLVWSLLLPKRTRKGFRFTFKQLYSVTGGFGESNVVGHGRIGLVYRGVLHDCRKVVVKLMDRTRKQGEDEFKVEVKLLSRLRSLICWHCLALSHFRDAIEMHFEYTWIFRWEGRGQKSLIRKHSRGENNEHTNSTRIDLVRTSELCLEIDRKSDETTWCYCDCVPYEHKRKDSDDEQGKQLHEDEKGKQILFEAYGRCNGQGNFCSNEWVDLLREMVLKLPEHFINPTASYATTSSETAIWV